MSMSPTALSAATVSNGERFPPKDYPVGTPVLVVDDDEDVRKVMVRCLKIYNVTVVEAETLKKARKLFESGAEFSMVFLDRCLPDGDGIEYSRELLARFPEITVVIVTGNGSASSVFEAMERGVFHYIAKPCGSSQIREALLKRYPNLVGGVQNSIGPAKPVDGSTDSSLPANMDGSASGVTLVGESPVMVSLCVEIIRIAQMTRPVLVTGRTGVGKEVVAQKIHELSARRENKFAAVNCGAMPAELVESLLFGHVKGSFTSAHQDRKGVFEDADGGTVFLDEITETTPAFQVKLLRVLQENCITKVGSNQEVRLDVRVIASSNRDVVEEVKAGRFREDLYFRLKGSEIFLPPLKERREDIVPLAEYFAQKRMEESGKRVKWSPSVLPALMAYDWPGNVRELETAIEAAVEGCTGVILVSDFPQAIRLAAGSVDSEAGEVIGLSEVFASLAEVEDGHCLKALALCKGNKADAAKLLKVDRSSFGKKCRAKGWETSS